MVTLTFRSKIDAFSQHGFITLTAVMHICEGVYICHLLYFAITSV